MDLQNYNFWKKKHAKEVRCKLKMIKNKRATFYSVLR